MNRLIYTFLPLLLLLASSPLLAQQQCGYGTNVPYVDLTPAGPGQTATNACCWSGDYMTVSVVMGETYIFSTCNSGYAGDTQLDLWGAGGAPFIAGNDDACGLLSEITWVATFTGTVELHLYDFNCLTPGGTCIAVEVTQVGAPVASCDYQLDMFDSFGDGWDGSSVDVLINGVVVNSYTVTAASNTVTFSADSCDVVSLSFSQGAFALFDNEVSYNLYELPDLVTPIYSADYSVTPILIGTVFNTTCGGCGSPTPPNNITCDSMSPICLDAGLNFTVSSTGTTMAPGNNYDCLLSGPDPNWFYIDVATSGDIIMALDAPADIDFIIWGPFSDTLAAVAACGNLGQAPTATNGSVIDCSYDPTNNETPQILGAVAGEVYVMLITNYANTSQPITLSQTGGTGSTNCALCDAFVGTHNNTFNAAAHPSDTVNLCENDCFEILSNNDFVLPTAVVGEEAEMMFAIYTCAPTNPDPSLDPCYTGFLWTDKDFADCNNAASLLLSLGLGNQFWMAHTTADDGDNNGNPNGVINWDNNGDNCYEVDLNTPIQITFLNPITVTISETCSGTQFTLSGGLPEFDANASYTILNTGAGTATQTGAQGEIVTIDSYTAGQTVSFNVTDDGASCTANFNYLTTMTPPGLTLDNIDSVSCGGASDGVIQITPNGVPGFTYLWSNSATTEDLSGLPPGSYTVTVTDGNSCTTTGGPYVITEPSPLLITLDSINDVSCNGANDGSVNITTSGGSPGYSFVWSNAATDEDITGLSGNSYSVTATDLAGCTATSGPHNVSELSAVSVTIDNVTDQTCASGGTVSITASGGAGGFTFIWNNGATDEDLTGLPAASYDVTVTDLSGCTATAGPAVVGSSGAPIITIDSTTNPSCAGGSDGAIYITTSGGAAPYTYIWSNAATDEDITGLSAAVYTVTLSDASSCTTTANVTITDPAPMGISFATTDPLCNGGTDGCIVTTVTGGTGNYTYLWSPGAMSTDSFCGLAAGTYNVTVTDTISSGSGGNLTLYYEDFEGAHGWNMNVPTGFNDFEANTWLVSDDEGGVLPPGCGVALNGDKTMHITCTSGFLCQIGATGALYYAAPTSETHLRTESPVFSTVGQSNLSLTFDYIGNGEGLDDNGSVWYNDGGGWTMLVPSLKTLCCGGVVCSGFDQGEWANLVVALPASCDNNPNVQVGFVWDNDNDTQGTDPSVAINNVHVYTSNSNPAVVCSVTGSTVLNEPTAIGVVMDSTTNLTCNGDSSGAAYTTISGGTPGYTFLWSDGSTDEDAMGLAGGNYNITVTDNNGCTTTGTQVTITEPSAITITEDNIVAANCGVADGEAFISVAGGTPVYTYLWSDGQTTEDATGLIAAAYTVVVTDANSCMDSLSVVVNNNSGPDLTLVSTIDVACNGDSAGAIGINTNNGTAPFTYLWSDGQTTEDATGLAGGVYSVTVTDDNGCVFSLTGLTVTEPSALAVTPNSSVDESCAGALDGSIDVDVAGGTVPYTFNWTGGETTEDLTGIGAGTYTITVTDDNGCSDTTSVTITAPAGISSTMATIVPLEGCGGEALGELQVTASGGSGTYTYNWSDGTTGATNSGLVAGAYTVTILDAAGGTCVTTATGTIGSPMIPVVTPFIITAGITDTTVTWGDVITLDAGNDQTSQGVSYFWSETTGSGVGMNFSDQNAPVTTVQPDEDGSYAFQVVATSVDGCQDSATVTLTVEAELEVFMPDAFTPNNGDTENDLFRPLTPSGPLDAKHVLEFKIFNRFGEKVYDSADLTGGGWDGTFRGREQPRDGYMYILQYQTPGMTEPLMLRGDFALLR